MDTIEVIFAIGVFVFFIIRAVEKSFKTEEKKNDFPKKIITEKKNIEPINKVSSKFKPAIKETYINKTSTKNSTTNKKEENKSKNISKEEHRLLVNINNVSEAKKAFIYSEIFKRKY